MMGKKKVDAGAPAWVLTYGDMMSLLLCFFILLAAFADYEAGGGSQHMLAALQSIQQALGMEGQFGELIDQSVDFNSLAKKLETIVTTIKEENRGDSAEQGIYGDHFRVRRIRDGMEITLGGPIIFEPFSDQITEQGAAALQQIAANLKGHRNKIEVHGHAGETPATGEWSYNDAMKLSYARAERIMNELVDQGVDARTLRIVAAGASEPVVQRNYDPSARSDNRRVEIIIRESLIDDYSGQTPVSRPAPQDDGVPPADLPLSAPVTAPAPETAPRPASSATPGAPASQP